MSLRQSTRSAKLDLRLTPDAKETLKEAAAIAHRSISEFVLESALAKANETLAERRTFVLEPERWKAFLAALDAPPCNLPRMARLLKEPGFFDSESEQ